jgi:hypothetical protein
MKNFKVKLTAIEQLNIFGIRKAANEVHVHIIIWTKVNINTF